MDSPIPTFVPPPTPLMKRIGYGTGVSVYQLDRSPANHIVQSPWALKKANRIHKSVQIQNRLEKEAQILKGLNHPNIVGYRGIAKTEDGQKVLAMEKCHVSLGDLIEVRNDNCEERFPSDEIIKVIIGVAKALQYLHEENGLLHGDLKSYNVLIKNHFDEVKLCDFGVSLKLSSATVDDYVGSGPWTAPEALMDGPLTEKADIFSLGLIIWEMLNLKLPNMNSFSEGETDVESEELFGETPPLPEGLPAEYNVIKEIYDWCTKQDYEARPKARDILNYLTERGISINTQPPLITL